MTSFRTIALAVVCAGTLTFASCSTTHLVRWGMDKDSMYTESDSSFVRGILKPFITIVGFPVALAWDIGTFPFQTIFGVYPYGDRYMQPDEVNDI
jgi:hypothetical protein